MVLIVLALALEILLILVAMIQILILSLIYLSRDMRQRLRMEAVEHITSELKKIYFKIHFLQLHLTLRIKVLLFLVFT